MLYRLSKIDLLFDSLPDLLLYLIPCYILLICFYISHGLSCTFSVCRWYALLLSSFWNESCCILFLPLQVTLVDFSAFYKAVPIDVLENPFLHRDIQVHNINNLFWSNRMILLINVVVMLFSFLVVYLVNDDPVIVNHKLCLYGMLLFLSRIIILLSSFVYGSWNLLFCRIYKRQKAWKMFLYFLGRLNPLCYMVHLLWNRDAFSYQTFNLLDVPAYVALIKVKQKASQSVGYVKTIVDQKH